MANMFKKDRSRIRSINWYWDAINSRKRIRGATCHAIHWYAKADDKYMKKYNKDNELLHIMYLYASNLYG